MSPDELAVPIEFAFSTVADDVFVDFTLVSVATLFLLLTGKTRSAPWSSVLCASKAFLSAFSLMWRYPERMLTVQARKTKSVFYLNFSTLRGGLFLERWTSPNEMSTLAQHACQLIIFALSDVLLETCCFAFALAAETFEETFVFVALMLPLSSVWFFKEIIFMHSWASAFSLTKSLKSIMVGLNQPFFTVCVDYASFTLGGSFWTAWIIRDELCQWPKYA